MKIGILTQPLGHNYGGMLQNWALQQVLIQLGHQPITIDAYRYFPLYRYYIRKVIVAWHRLMGNNSLSYPPKPYKSKRCSPITSAFVENHIITTRPVYSPTLRLIDHYDIEALIVGSDQVWRPQYNQKSLENMFLDFALNRDCIKIAYAASFGNSQWEFSEEQTDKCKFLIKQFNSISVREESAVHLCKTKLNADAIQVLDPTLLLDKRYYEALCEDIPINNQKSLFVYCLDLSDDKINYFQSVADENNLILKLFSADKDVQLTVEQWLAMFRDSQAVITDSFHGTIFSIIFKKPFNTIVNEHRGASRFESLLSQLGLEHRMNTKDIFQQENWDKVVDLLVKLQNDSLTFLREALR